MDLGDLPLRAIQADPGLLQKSAQTLMVYQAGGTHFQVSLSIQTNDPKHHKLTVPVSGSILDKRES